jgi:hypothetical protein
MNTKNIKLKFLLLTGLINNNSHSKNTFVKIGAGAGAITSTIFAYEKRHKIKKFYHEKIKTIFDDEKPDTKKDKDNDKLKKNKKDSKEFINKQQEINDTFQHIKNEMDKMNMSTYSFITNVNDYTAKIYMEATPKLIIAFKTFFETIKKINEEIQKSKDFSTLKKDKDYINLVNNYRTRDLRLAIENYINNASVNYNCFTKQDFLSLIDKFNKQLLSSFAPYASDLYKGEKKYLGLVSNKYTTHNYKVKSFVAPE